jgi:hypothetical protein
MLRDMGDLRRSLLVIAMASAGWMLGAVDVQACVCVGSPQPPSAEPGVAGNSEVMALLDRVAPRRAPSAAILARPTVAVIGTVRNPGLVPWHEGLTVAQALALAGGAVPPMRPEFAQYNLTSKVVRRRSGAPLEAYPAILTATLQHDDQLFVAGDIPPAPLEALSPCAMCSGAILLYRIPHVVVGENRSFVGEEALLTSRGVRVDVVQDPDCIRLMATFMREHPELWHEDIGEEPQ